MVGKTTKRENRKMKMSPGGRTIDHHRITPLSLPSLLRQWDLLQIPKQQMRVAEPIPDKMV